MVLNLGYASASAGELVQTDRWPLRWSLIQQAWGGV